MNIHKRCQQNVANNCGIDTKQMAEILAAMGITTDKLTPQRPKVINSFNKIPINSDIIQ